MSWKKYFKIVTADGSHSPINGSTGGHKAIDTMGYNNYGSMLPEVYMGHPNRVERYNQYEAMDLDSEVNAALDILSEFSTQVDSKTNLAFELHFLDDPTETEAKILKQQLQTWYNLNEFDKRLFKIFRNVLKYGDQIFLRDPETFKLFYVDMTSVIKVIVNESDGKKPEQYVIRNINPNFENLTVTAVTADNLFFTAPNTAGYGAAAYNMPNNPYSTNNRFVHGLNEKAVGAQHILHLSLTEGLDPNWPFGNSILELIFKVYKQKELLEDAIIIYRVQRAPERRVFYIDVGEMPSHLAMAFVDRVKNEIHQRRIPTQAGGQNFMDSTYYPLPINADFFFPQTATGRGSKVETLPGGQNLGEIDDLRHFTNKMMRGLRIPSSYLPTGPDDSPVTFNDGRVGTALIQEHRFNQYCRRLQNLIAANLDIEFKAFVKWSGVNIDTSMFQLKFNEPQNFAHYREAELDSTKIGTFTQLEGYPYFSKQWLMKRYLGLTPDEIAENDEMWREEHVEPDEDMAEDPDLRNLGISPGGIETDLENFGSPEDLTGGEEGAEGAGQNPAGGAGTPPAGAPGGGAGAPGGGSPGAAPAVGNM